LPVLQKVMEIGYPVLWNVTITGLGGTPVEPQVPATDKALAAISSELAGLVSPAAIQWRYDPIFWSQRYDAEHHVRTFKSLAERLGKTIVFVTHDVREAVALASRIALLDQGRLVFAGTVEEFNLTPDPQVTALRGLL